MATLLLFVIYIAFIGLGVPDSLFGTVWPAIYPEFDLPVSAASVVTLLISGCTVVSSLLSARIINRLGTAAVTAASTALTAAALLGFSLSGNLPWLCLFALPLGIGAGAIDSGLNNYVALHYRAAHMNFLHCFYGIGVSLSPYLMSLALADGNQWRLGYRRAFFVQTVIVLLVLLSLPLWKKTRPAVSDSVETEPVKTLRMTEMMKIPAVRTVWWIFIGSCAIENTCGTWGSTFLVDAKGMTAEQAAGIITVYYVGMTLSRFLSGILSARLSSWKLIYIGQGIMLAALLLLALPSSFSSAAGLFLIGLGVGPVFPNLIHLTPANFGRDISQSVMGTQMAATYMGIMLMPPVFGFLAQAAGAFVFPYYLLALFAVMIAATWLLGARLKKQGRYSG